MFELEVKSNVDQFSAALGKASNSLPDLIAEAIQSAADARRLHPIAATSALALLPHAGGLGALVAGSLRVVNVVQRTSDGARVVIKGKAAGLDLLGLDEGQVVHPVFGRGRWVHQRIPSGWWTRACSRYLPQRTESELLKAIDKLRALLKR
jgi:hypothetical protein